MKSIFGKIALVVFLVVAVAVVFHLKGNKPDPAGETLQLVTSSSAFTESTSQPEEAKNVFIPRFLELGADKCVPCKMMQPILDELRKDYPGKLQVDFIDVWKEPAQAEKYAVSGIPTQIIFDANGKEVFRHAGFFPKDQIMTQFKTLGIQLP